MNGDLKRTGRKCGIFLVDLPCIVAVLYGEVGLSGFEVRTGFRSLWRFWFGYFIYFFLILVFIFSLLAFVLARCLSLFSSSCSASGSLPDAHPWARLLTPHSARGYVPSEGGCDSWTGWAMSPPERSCLPSGGGSWQDTCIPATCQHCSAFWAGDLQ